MGCYRADSQDLHCDAVSDDIIMNDERTMTIVSDFKNRTMLYIFKRTTEVGRRKRKTSDLRQSLNSHENKTAVEVGTHEQDLKANLT